METWLERREGKGREGRERRKGREGRERREGREEEEGENKTLASLAMKVVRRENTELCKSMSKNTELCDCICSLGLKLKQVIV